MTHIHDDMQETKNHVDTENTAKTQEKQAEKQMTEQTEKQMNEILYGIAKDLISGDDSQLVQMDVKKPGFEILLINHDGHNPTPFSVTATCKGNDVELHISDGKWDNSPNVSGNWGHWADEKIVYSGPVSESKVYKVINDSFITWYKRALQ